jgi:toxin YoeB
VPDTTFSEEGFADYMYWQTQDRKTLNKINALVSDIKRNGFTKGIGKPEPLKHKNGYSRRIDDTNRLIYEATETNTLRIVSCKGHYDD